MSSWMRKMLSRNVTPNCWELNLEVELVSSSPSSRSSFSSGTNEVSAQAEKIPWKRRVKAMSSSVMQQEKPLQTRHQVSESEGEENENDKDDALLELEGHRRLQDARGLQDNIKGSVGPTIILKHRQRQLFSHRRKRRRLWPMLGVWLLLLAFEALSLTDAFVLEGSQTSYAQFRKWLPTTNSSIEFEFLTDQPNGILLYTDDGGYYDFIEVKLVEGSVRLRFNFDREPKVLTVGRNLNDGRTWHKVIIARNGLETALTVDQIRATAQLPKPKRPEDLNFGNITLNSYVYVGGLPSWYTTRLSNLALPSVVFEPRFQGAIRNLVYVDEGSEAKPRRQEVMAYRGVRASTVDACEHHNPCKHGGICISTDGGPLCECRYIDFEGVFCEQSMAPPEATFKGDEYLSYDLVQLGGQPILSTQDEISLHFKTTRPDGLLFHTGNGKDYLNLSLQDGKVALTINLGSGRLDTGIKPRDIKFNDDKWHHVLIVRAAKELTFARSVCDVNMTVDNTFTEKWMTTGSFTMLESAKVFIGGSEAPYKLPGSGNKNNFVGCLKKVEFRADSIHLPLLKLAKDGNGLMNAVGKIAFQCSSTQSILPIAFTSSDSNLILPTWNNTESGSLSFKFRTIEPTGLMFFNGGGLLGKGDFFAMEMMEGYLYKHIDLGSGAVKLRASNRRLDDGAWHKVEILRNQRSGTISVDEELHSFETPGEAFKLELDGPLYVGGLDPSLEPYRVPPVLWTASLRKGYVGCLRDLVINGYTVDIAQFASQQDSGSIRSSCHIMPPKCPEKPCLQGGTCIEGWNRYICDCSKTSFTGSTCGKPAATIHLNGNQHLSINDLGRGVSEAEEITFRFQTKQSHAFLLATRHDSSTDRLEITLESGRLQLSVTMGMTAKTVIVGDSLNDDIWHTVMMKRMGMIITLGVDDDTPLVAEIYGSESFLDYSRLHVGAIYPSHVIPSTAPNFIGHIQQLVFNGIPYLEHILSGLYHDHVLSGTFGRQRGILYHTITFTSHYTYLGLPQMKAYNEVNIYFQFRTLEPDGLIMYNAGKGKDFLAIEMVAGHLHYVFNLGHDTVVLRDTSAKALNDNLWHSVSIGRPSKTKHTLLIDDNQLATVTADGRDIHLDLDGILFLGGVRSSMYGKLPKEVQATKGYHGCLASLDLNGEATDPLNNALVPSTLVNEGCDESVAYEWGSKQGLIRYYYHLDHRPDTRADVLSLGFITPLQDCVVIRVDSEASNDYIELEIVGGNIFVAYNLGTEDLAIGDMSVRVDDGKYHVVRFTRSGPNSTLQIDDNQIQAKHPYGRQLTVFNGQSQIQLGGKWNPTLSRVERPFRGVMAGLVYNGLRPLDLAAKGDGRTKVQGDVRILDNIPFDYRERNRRLFDDQKMQQTNPSNRPEPGVNDELVYGRSRCTGDDDMYYDPKCFSFDGSVGDELITPVYITPTRPPWREPKQPYNPYQPCDDDDEDCGSGLEDNEQTYTRAPTYILTTTTTTTEDWLHWQSTTEAPKPLTKAPIISTSKPQIIYENYDTKYNVYDKEPEIKDPPPQNNHVSAATAPSTILVIGIIVFAMIAIVLIVVIVLKTRTSADGNFKVEEARTYHFAPPADEFTPTVNTLPAGSTIVPTSAAVIRTSATTMGDSNGFYGNGNTATVKKNNGKPIREWYV